MAWRLAIPAIALLSVNMFYLAYLQATFRSDSDFERLARVHWVQAGMLALLPLLVSAFGFVGLCVHAVLQAVVVTAYAHAVRPLPVRPRFEPALARQLVATGFPLFLATYLQTAAVGLRPRDPAAAGAPSRPSATTRPRSPSSPRWRSCREPSPPTSIRG